MSSMRDRVMAARSSNKARLYPLWTAWRMQQKDHVFSDGALELAAQVLSRRENTFPHMRNSPSAGGTCRRASVLSFFGHRSDSVDSIGTQHIFDNGNFIHLKWQMYLYDMGVLAQAEVPLAKPEFGVVGTCDGIVQIPEGDWYRPTMTREQVRSAIEGGSPHWTAVLEIKGWNAYKWRSVKAANQPDDRTRWQGDVYHLAAQWTLPEMNVQGTCYWLENKETSAIMEFDLACTDVSRKNMTEYYSDVLDHVERNQLPERPHAPDSFACKYCPVSTECERFEADGVTLIESVRGHTRGFFNGEMI